jgi:zinc transport system permease protein
VDGWYRSVLLTVFIGVVAYLISFTVAMLVDFPFGPVLVAVLVAASALRFFSGARHRVPRMRKLD